jgi:hypothetical protein
MYQPTDETLPFTTLLAQTINLSILTLLNKHFSQHQTIWHFLIKLADYQQQQINYNHVAVKV